MYFWNPRQSVTAERKRTMVLISLVMSLFVMTSGCSDGPVSSVPTIIANPYNISPADIQGATELLMATRMKSEQLASLGKPVINPYEFTGQDVQWAEESQREAARHRDFWLTVSETRIYPPNREQINAGREYWLSEKAAVEEQQLPYWLSELELASRAEIPAWIQVCNEMIRVQNLRVELIDAMLTDLDLDECWLDGDCSRSGVKQRKVSLFIREIKYYSEVIYALNLATQLEIPDWSGLGTFIADAVQVIQGKDHWRQLIDSTSATEIPYWEKESERAARCGDEVWLDFTQHMVGNLHQYLQLATTNLVDLGADSVLSAGISGEPPHDIAARKQLLAQLETDYYGDLVAVLWEGASLAILAE